MEKTIKDLKLDNRNANKHTEAGNKLLKKSINELGYGRSILLDKDERIIAGNGVVTQSDKNRKVIIVESDGTELIAVKRKDISLDSKKGRELAIADNQTAKIGIEFDYEDLDKISNDYEIDLIDWDFEEKIADKCTQDIGYVDDDYEAPENLQTKIVRGDLITFEKDGKELHRLLCGDSTNIDDVSKLMNGEKWQIGITSPPYNNGTNFINYDDKKKESGFYRNNKDDMSKQQYFDFCISILTNYFITKNEDSHSLFWNVMYNANSRDDYGKIIFSEKNPFRLRETIIWDKGSGFPIANDNILSRNTELIFLLSNSKKYRTNQTNKTIYWNKWQISNNNAQQRDNGHKACFPVGLPKKAIEDFSKENDLILDLFLGSGTTMLASHQMNRRCNGIELDEYYCQLIINRMLKIDNDLKIKINGVNYINQL